MPGTVVLEGVRRLAGVERDSQAHAASRGLLVIGQLTIQPGQVLALGYAQNTPEGFLGRVDAITLLQGGQASLQTEPATLQEAGAQGALDLSNFRQIGPEGSPDRAAGSRTLAASVSSSAFNPDVSEAFTCQDGTAASLNGNVSVSVTPALHASFSLIHGLTSASFSLTGSASASLTAQANASTGCTLPSTALLKDPLHIGTFAGDIGPIPVVVVLQGQVFVDANISGKASVQSDIKASTSITGGIQWRKGAPNGGFSPIFNGPNASFHFDPPSVTASGTATADVEPALQMLLYGVAGPQLEVKAGLALDADITKDPWWKLTAPVSLDASFTAPDLDLAGGRLPLYQHTFDIADSGGPFNGTASVTIPNPGSQTTTAGTPVSLQVHAIDSDGGALAYTASGLPAGLSINQGSGLITGTPTTAGTTNVTVIAIDASGPSNSTSFTWTINPANIGSSATEVSVGTLSACAVVKGGAVYCWGDNGAGELGDGSTTGPDSCTGSSAPCSETPVAVQGISDATQVSAGENYACAILSTGSVDCWGDNIYGQLGIGSSTGPQTCFDGDPCSTTPVEVPGITDATEVTASSTDLTCALTSGGAVYCWGSNTNADLGNNTMTNSTTPVQVSGLSTATQIAAGGDDACALLSGGGIDCWGDNQFGELGIGTDTTPGTTGVCYPGGQCSGTPWPVSQITNATEVTAGDQSVCAALAGGQADCWGSAYNGQIGDGSYTGPDSCSNSNSACSTSPTPVSNIATASEVSAGGGGACAVLSGGAVDCWGANNVGELGDGTSSGPGTCADNGPCSTTPVTVSNITTAADVSTNGSSACALLSDGALECWGDNTWGQLGDGTTTERDVPVQVAGFS